MAARVAGYVQHRQCQVEFRDGCNIALDQRPGDGADVFPRWPENRHFCMLQQARNPTDVVSMMMSQ